MVYISTSPLKRVASSGFHPVSITSTCRVQILKTALLSCLYSTSSTPISKEIPLSSLPPLPEQSEWRSVFVPPRSASTLRERVSIRNPQTAGTLAERFTTWTKPLLKADKAMGKGKAAKGAPRVIIEAFPGTLGLYSLYCLCYYTLMLPVTVR